MDVDVMTETIIDRPRAEVASYAADPANATAWYKNIKRVVWDPHELVRGSKIGFEAEFLGRKLAYTYEVVDLTPGERLVMSTSDGPFAMETTYEWRDAPGGATVMTLRNRGKPPGFASAAAPVMAAAMRRANNKDLARLKSILESRSPA